jgi:hypothetical protein
MNTIVQDHQDNFDTLNEAFKNDDVCLMDCIEKATGEHVAVICATTIDPKTKEYVMVPFARFFNGNPYEMLINPSDPKYIKEI